MDLLTIFEIQSTLSMVGAQMLTDYMVRSYDQTRKKNVASPIGLFKRSSVDRPQMLVHSMHHQSHVQRSAKLVPNEAFQPR